MKGGVVINEVYVVDSIMGSGKTSAVINCINSLPQSQRVIVVVLYKSELKRIKDACTSKELYEPDFVDGRKLNGARLLLEEGKSIVTTHALLTLFEDVDIELVKSKNYICFLDETLDCISPYKTEDGDDVLDKYDIEVFIDRYVSVKEDGYLEWKVDDYDRGRFINEKKLVMNNRLIYSNGSLMLVFPISILKAFVKTYILTYLFDGSIMYCYLQKYNIDYKLLYITGTLHDNMMFTDDKSLATTKKINYRDYINILDDKKLNEIGDGYTDLSVGWYKRAESHEFNRLYLNMYNYFKNITSTKNKYCMWTTFSTYKDAVLTSGKKDSVSDKKEYSRYRKNFVSINKRASNEYSECKTVAYLVNRFMNVSVSSYFKGCGVKPKEDLFALSEMIQFIWRSAIRNGEPINVYVPSSRMRNLLINWINENSVDE